MRHSSGSEGISVRLNADRLCGIYLVLSMLLFLFVSTEEGTGLPIHVPYLNGLVIYYHAAVMFILFIAITVVKRGIIKIDIVVKLLVVKCITDLISYLFNINSVPNGYFGYFACSVTAVVSYVICSQSKADVKQYYKYFLLFGLVITIQTIWTAFLSGASFLDITYKGSMNIPYGASNVIASAIVPLIVLPFYMNMKIYKKIILSGLMLTGVILTKSRGGYF